MTTGYGNLFSQGGRYRERDVIKEITQGARPGEDWAKSYGRNFSDIYIAEALAVSRKKKSW